MYPAGGVHTGPRQPVHHRAHIKLTQKLNIVNFFLFNLYLSTQFTRNNFSDSIIKLQLQVMISQHYL